MTLQENHSQSVARLVHGTPISVPLVGVAANSLIALFCLADADNGNVTESLSIGTTGGLTWTRAVQANGSPGACAAVFTAPFAAGGSITPTVVDSDGMADASAEIGVIPVIFTDTNGGIPGVGATAIGTGITNVTTTVANSWVWGAGFGQGIDDANQTRIFSTSGGSFDGGDDINVAKQNATTPTPGTIVPLTLGQLHTVCIEIKPGISGGTTPVVIDDSTHVAGALAASVVEAAVIGTSIPDLPSAAVAASTIELVQFGVVVVDNAPMAALAASTADSTAIGVNIADAPSGALAASPAETFPFSVTIIDQPAAAIGVGPLAFEGILQGTFVDGSQISAGLAGAWQETLLLGVPPGDVNVLIREALASAYISQASIASHVALAVVASDISEARASIDVAEADVTSELRG